MPTNRSGPLRSAAITTALCAVGLAAFPAGAAAISAHGQLLAPAPTLGLNTNQSSNWFGYNQGTLEQGGKLFKAITGDWTVPTATQHASGQAEFSSDWIGIGGGCVTANCLVGDQTLIQTGTEQDVAANGAASYSAWYEVIPAPSLTISAMKVSAGDHMHASVSQVVGGVDLWKITLQDVTRGESFSTTLPYPSTMATAEWIEETPLILGTNAGFAALPNLTDPAFNSGTVNGSTVKLSTSEEIQLIDSSGNVIGTPSAPNSAGSGFSECTWTNVCP